MEQTAQLLKLTWKETPGIHDAKGRGQIWMLIIVPTYF